MWLKYGKVFYTFFNSAKYAAKAYYNERSFGGIIFLTDNTHTYTHMGIYKVMLST